MGPPSNRVKLKNSIEKSSFKMSKTTKNKENSGATKLKPVKMPLGEKNIGPTITMERRLSVREGAKKSSDKITEFCRKIKNTKTVKDKENAPLLTNSKRRCQSPSPVPQAKKVKNNVADELKQAVEMPSKTALVSNDHVFLSPQTITPHKSTKSISSNIIETPTRRLSVREGSRKSKDKIAEICKNIKNNKNPKNKENASTQNATTVHDPPENNAPTNNKEKKGITIEINVPQRSMRLRRPNKNNQKDNMKNVEIRASLAAIKQTATKSVLQEKKTEVLENNAIEKNHSINESIKEKPAAVEDKENSSPQKALKRKCITSPLGQKAAKRIINKDFSFRVLDEKKTQEDAANKEAVYDFTFDPSEEPPQQKKKRKQAAKKKAKPKPKPKPIIINNNYAENISKTLQSLKNSVNKKVADDNQSAAPASKTIVAQAKPVQITKEKLISTNTTAVAHETENHKAIESPVHQMDTNLSEIQLNEPEPITETVSHAITKARTPCKTPIHKSTQNNVQDIEALWEPEDNDNMNYSPAHMSFNNVLSSTLNTSVRLPQDSPWRPNFESLPFKWPANSYVKPNMTPAVETSFVISDKKHVYTNMLPEDDTPPEVVEPEPEKETPKLRQSSIMSFIGEVTERTTRRTRNQRKINGPSRANLPRMAINFAPSSDVVNKLYNDMKAATDAPEVPERNDDGTNIEPASDEADEGSVHLFEDIDLVHHLKPTRKSYGKAKKLTFCKTVVNNTAQGDAAADSDSDDERQALDDLTFEIPNLKTKKAVKKKKGIKLTKKEEEEVEAWAAAFNSMCEDVDEFPLLTE